MKTTVVARIAITIIAIVALLSIAAAPFPSVSKFRAILVESTLQVLGASTFTGVTNVGTLTNVGALVQVGALSVTGDTTFTGSQSVSAFRVTSPASTVIATSGTPITALGSFQPISAAGSVGMTLTVLAAGTQICLENIVAQTITITDTGTTMLTGTISLGQYDVLCVISDGTNMVQTSYANN